jgi:hypothetical protein
MLIFIGGKIKMPKTKFQHFIFSAMMSIIMAYGMELYNVAQQMGGMSNSVFLPALIGTSYMCLFVFIISNLCGNKIGQMLAFKHVTPGKDNPFLITIIISSCTIVFMCPAMSLIATIIFSGISTQFAANWLATLARNFPMALFWQLFCAGPIVRLLFRTIFKKQLTTDFQKEINKDNQVVEQGA